MAPRPRVAHSFTVLLVVALGLAGCSGGGGSDPTAESRPRRSPSTTATDQPGPGIAPVRPLEWRACDAIECATLTVPLDRTDPNGPQVDLAVARASRARDGERIGSLVVNPGGPGASGLNIVDYAASSLPDAITDRFDVVAWDPRGSGESAPVNCGSELDFRFAVDSTPEDPGELAALEGAAQDFVDACVARTGDRLRHISSADTVMDLDELRAALGDERLTFLGLSYGTYIGGMYAARYPTRVRALVLDGALDPALSAEDVSVEQSKGFDASLTEFFAWCSARPTCAFRPGGDPAAAYRALVRRIDANPLGDGSDRFGSTQLDIAVAALLYGGSASYRELAAGLHDLERGRSAALEDAVDEYLGRSPDGRYNNEWAAFVAISCADGPNLTLAAAEALQRRARIEAPYFGAANVGLGYECSFWPYPATRSGPVSFAAPTAPPIVVVGTRGDPATPPAWARGLAEQLQVGRLVTVDDTTHTASLNQDPCLDAILERYLVALQAPETGTTCPAR